MGFRVKDRIRSFRHAGSGLWLFVAREHNAWIHASGTVVAIGLGLGFGLSTVEWCAIVLAIGLVWVAEAFNTALELLADAAVPERNEQVGRAKDVAAGAVLLAAVSAAAVGVIVFLPRVLGLVCS